MGKQISYMILIGVHSTMHLVHPNYVCITVCVCCCVCIAVDEDQEPEEIDTSESEARNETGIIIQQVELDNPHIETDLYSLPWQMMMI